MPNYTIHTQGEIYDTLYLAADMNTAAELTSDNVRALATLAQEIALLGCTHIDYLLGADRVIFTVVDLPEYVEEEDESLTLPEAYQTTLLNFTLQEAW